MRPELFRVFDISAPSYFVLLVTGFLFATGLGAIWARRIGQDPDSIVVNVAGASIARDPTHTNGWDWEDQEFGVIELFGDACNTATPKNVSGTIQCRDD